MSSERESSSALPVRIVEVSRLSVPRRSPRADAAGRTGSRFLDQGHFMLPDAL
jgi:hypothetical protein